MDAWVLGLRMAKAVLVGVTLLLVFSNLIAGLPYLFSTAHDNLGAIELAKCLAQPEGERFQAAEGYLNEALAWAPQKAQSYRHLGQLYLAQGDYLHAATVLVRATELEPQDELAHFALGKAYQGLGQRDKALAEWKQAAALRPLIEMGRRLQAQKEWDEALKVYRTAVGIDPSNAWLHRTLGWVLYWGKKDLEAALSEYEISLTLAPREVSSHIDLGDIYRQEKDFQTAAYWYARAQQLEPHDEALLISLGINALLQGRSSQAEQYFEQALARNPYNARIHLYLAQVYRQQGLPARAIIELEEACRLAPDSALAHQLLADAYREGGQLEKARAEYEKTLALDAHNAHARQELEKLEQRSRR
jgi:tetratricopeptide (TPR) repeat protein